MYREPDITLNGTPIVKLSRLFLMGRRSERERTPFGQRMLEARSTAGLTQMEVCKTLSVSQSTLSELETDANSSGRVTEFALLYGCNANWLATGEGSPDWPAQRGGQHWVSDSDWALLRDVKAVLDQDELQRIHRKAEHARQVFEAWRNAPAEATTATAAERTPTYNVDRRRRAPFAIGNLAKPATTAAAPRKRGKR